MTTKFAWRYFISRKSANAINIIAWISMVAIALVTAALVVVLSVFNGFEDMVKSMYGDFYADIKISSVGGKWLTATDSVLAICQKQNGVLKATSVIEERSILLDQEDKSIVWLKGVDESYKNFSGVPHHLVRGQFSIGTVEHPAVVLGAGIENALQITAGQSLFPITVYLPNRNASNFSDPLEALRSANAMASGSFVVQQDFDNQYAFTNKAFLQYMLDLQPNQVSAIEIFTSPHADINSLRHRLKKMLGKEFLVNTRYQQNQGLFAAMQTEKLIIYAIAVLILIIASFNIISSLTMTVLEKQQDIAVLQAMGTYGANISVIFLKLGALLAASGGAIGFCTGLVICVCQQHFHFVKLAGESFLIDYYPVAMRLSDFFLIGIIVFVIAFFSGWLPSRRAAKTTYSLR